MNKSLVTRSLQRTAVACTCFVPHIGHVEATLVRHHATGNVELELPWRTHLITSGETRFSDSGIAITELIRDNGTRYYVQSAAGDVWAAIHGVPQAVASREVEITQIAS
jgi:hypothetical protein